MKIQTHPQGYTVIDQTFDERELRYLWNVIDFIQDKNLLEEPKDTGTAFKKSTPLKNNKAVFLDDIIDKPGIENFIHIISKLFEYQIANTLEKIHPCLSLYKNCNYTTNLLSYYEQGGNYKPHIDRSVFTVLTWLYKEPKKWNGGNLILNDFDQIIEVKNNRTLIIPGSYTHEVESVVMNTDEKFMGRYCITQFGYIKP